MNDLFEAARLEAEAVQPSRELVDVGEIVERVAAVLPGDDCAVQVEEALTLYADALYVQRIVTNLVSNALKYGAPPLTVSAFRDGGTVRISCSDQGQGVPPTFVPRLYQKFARSDEARAAKIEDTGLGWPSSRVSCVPAEARSVTSPTSRKEHASSWSSPRSSRSATG